MTVGGYTFSRRELVADVLLAVVLLGVLVAGMAVTIAMVPA